MRTTVVIEKAIARKIKSVIKNKKLSRFVNTCIQEHLHRQMQIDYMKEMEKAYARAASAAKTRKPKAIEVEDWPEW